MLVGKLDDVVELGEAIEFTPVLGVNSNERVSAHALLHSRGSSWAFFEDMNHHTLTRRCKEHNVIPTASHRDCGPLQDRILLLFCDAHRNNLRVHGPSCF